MSQRSRETQEEHEVEQARARDSRFTRLYGARPWHLAVLVLLLAATAFVVSRLIGNPALFRIAVWFVGVALVWDLVLGPLMALADRGLQAATRRLRAAGVSPLNFVRVPLLLSMLLLLMFAPSILTRSEGVYAAKAGLAQDVYLSRWLTVTGVLFGVSAVAFVVAVLRTRRR
ncbi:MAG TPA: hypothetical protein VM433_09040 [Mycobacteriales bacterium]|nr:hypothetical protein [Mycobacteriales bacterium]